MALSLGVHEGDEAVVAARRRLEELRSPEYQRRKERELRAAAAEKRLGRLTPAQEKFLRG